jgi:hypothetical protein
MRCLARSLIVTFASSGRADELKARPEVLHRYLGV